jgi:hypothetical protein
MRNYPWTVQSGKEWAIKSGDGQTVLLIGDERRLIPTIEHQRLIVAAPELLAALEGLLADKYLTNPINNDRMAQAKAAVNKAHGISQPFPLGRW